MDSRLYISWSESRFAHRESCETRVSVSHTRAPNELSFSSRGKNARLRIVSEHSHVTRYAERERRDGARVPVDESVG